MLIFCVSFDFLSKRSFKVYHISQLFMGRPIRIALSKKFLRKETKASMEQESTPSSQLNSDEEQTVEKTETSAEV